MRASNQRFDTMTLITGSVLVQSEQFESDAEVCSDSTKRQ